MKIYDSCDVLPIYNFYKLVDERDLSYMLYDREQKIDNKLKRHLITTFEKIVDEYSDLVRDKKRFLMQKELSSIIELEFKHNTCVKILELYEISKNTKDLLILNEIGFEYKENKSVDKQIKQILKSLKFLRNKIKIKQSKFDEKYKNKNNNKTDDRRLDKTAILLSLNLNMGNLIDPRKTSVKTWVLLLEINKEKSESYG